jgi:glycosyltransferase involved in cell wall biosynthesis
MTIPMWFVYLLRSDVRDGAAPEDQEAQREFVAWWMIWGRTEYPAVWHWGAAQAAIAMQLVSAGPDLLCPRMLRRVYTSRLDLQHAFPLQDHEGLAEFFCWYRIYAASELVAAPELPAVCMAMTESPSQRQPWATGGLQIPRIAVILAAGTPNLSSDACDLRRLPERVADWFGTYGRSLIPPPTPPPSLAVAQPGKQRRSGGVNLVGFVRGQSGLGEDVRMASAALEAAGVAHVLVDIPAGASIPQQDTSLAHLLTDRLPYDTTIYCMSAFDMVTLYLARGPAFFAEQYRIGYWPWELPRFPRLWDQAYTLVDEIWAGSKFTAHAYRGHRGCPIRWIPCPVVLPPVKPVPRGDLGLHDQDAFVFVYPFDVNSHLARKNPLSLVRAFRRAFPPAQRGVALLLRVNGDPNGHPGWLELMAESSVDDRISVLAGTLERAQALGVIAACDCLVSPHRAEGFGRNIAEAILLGIPVLATAFSGCMDFLAEEEEIPFEPVAVRDGDYPFADGMWWAEPSINEMARRMREVRRTCQASRTALDERLSQRCLEVTKAYSPLASGQNFAQRLRVIARSPYRDAR